MNSPEFRVVKKRDEKKNRPYIHCVSSPLLILSIQLMQQICFSVQNKYAGLVNRNQSSSSLCPLLSAFLDLTPLMAFPLHAANALSSEKSDVFIDYITNSRMLEYTQTDRLKDASATIP